MIKAIRIGYDLDSFLNEHPEIRVIKAGEKITHIIIPEEVNINYLVISHGTIISFSYSYNGETFRYEEQS